MKPVITCILFYLMMLGAADGQTKPTATAKPAPTTKKMSTIPPKKSAPVAVRLLITTDVACSLTVDGKFMLNLPVGGPTGISLTRGKHTLEATSPPDQGIWVHDVDSSGNPEVTQEVTVELLPVIRAEIIDALASQLVKEFVGALVEELPIGSGIGTTDESPQRILLGYDGTKAAEIKESVAAKGGGTFTSFRDSFVWEGHKIEFTGAWLEKGAGPPHFLEKSKLNWDGKAMIFDGTRWIDR